MAMVPLTLVPSECLLDIKPAVAIGVEVLQQLGSNALQPLHVAPMLFCAFGTGGGGGLGLRALLSWCILLGDARRPGLRSRNLRSFSLGLEFSQLRVFSDSPRPPPPHLHPWGGAPVPFQ